MKIVMRSTYAGPLGVLHPEQVVDFDEPTAQALIKGGFALPAEGNAPATATIRTPAAETAAKPPAK